jgi:hypothetical protein
MEEHVIRFYYRFSQRKDGRCNEDEPYEKHDRTASDCESEAAKVVSGCKAVNGKDDGDDADCVCREVVNERMAGVSACGKHCCGQSCGS